MSIAKRPKRIIITPEILKSSSLFFARKPPKKDAETPSVTNTTEKPRTNRTLGKRIFLTFRSIESFLHSSNDSFETIEIYPGISGSTHGDRNETTPARNAKIQLTSPTDGFILLFPIHIL